MNLVVVTLLKCFRWFHRGNFAILVKRWLVTQSVVWSKIFFFHRWVTLPRMPASSRTELSKRAHKCLPHLPRSSECRVSYEIALYGSEKRKPHRKCCTQRISADRDLRWSANIREYHEDRTGQECAAFQLSSLRLQLSGVQLAWC